MSQIEIAEPATELVEERNRRWDEPFGEEPLASDTVARILSLPTFANVSSAEFQSWLPLEKIIANDGRLRRFQRGEVIIRQGDYGNSLFVLLEGEAISPTVPIETGQRTRSRFSWWRSITQLLAPARPPEYRQTRRRWRGRRRSVPEANIINGSIKLDVDDVMKRYPTIPHGPLDVFGELAALTGRPRTLTVIATRDDTLLFELRWQGVRDIRTWSAPFRQRIDQLYRERGLVSRLRDCLILKHLNAQALDEIAKASLFETYGTVDWTYRFKKEKQGDISRVIEQETVICSEGDHVDGLLLINRGFARVTEHVDHGEQALDHLSVNDVFGLDEIAAIAAGANGVALKASLRAIGYVDVIRIPTKLVIKHILPGLAVDYRRDKRVAASGDPATLQMQQEMMDFLVDHRFINGEKAMVINLDRCVGCDDCVRACATAHDNNPRFTRQGFSHHNAMVVNACMHCTDPVCLVGCPTGAIHREEGSGTVVIDDGTCIGCATCANSCPYDNIKMVDIRDAKGDFLLDSEGHTISRATKCDLCVEQLTGPACVQACPHDALIRVDIRDSREVDDVAWLTGLFSRSTIINIAVGGATFALFYLESVRRDLALRDVQFFSGWTLAGCLVVMMLLGWRKKVIILPLGRVRFWLLVHYCIGFLAAAIFIVHTKHQLPGSVLHWLLWSLFLLVSLSGIAGAIIAKIVPVRLEAQGERVLFDRVPLLRAQLAEQAEAIARESVEDGNTRSIAKLYVDSLSDFFARPRNVAAHLAASKVPKARLLGRVTALERYLDESGKARLRRLGDLVEAKSNLDFHYANIGLLRLWLFVHVPATYGLLAVITVHVVLEYAFTAG